MSKVDITYSGFKRANKNHKGNNLPEIKITSVSMKKNLCEIEADGCRTQLSILSFACMVCFDEIGYVLNPSAIHTWRGWGDRFRMLDN